MFEKTTKELDNILEKLNPDQLDGYFRENDKYMVNDKKAFYYYMKDTLSKKNIKLKDVYSFAGVSESYGSKIIAMEKHTRDRDLIIRLCVAGHFSWNEMNRALKLYGLSKLYSKDPRDACIIVAINNRVFDLYQIDTMLENRGFTKISSDQ